MAASEVDPGGSQSDHDPTKPGPANPQDSDDLDSPTPPGGPLRSDAPAGPVSPGGPGTPVQPGAPEEVDRPRRPVGEPLGDAAGRAATTKDVNAETSQAEPSDDSGSE